MLDEDGVFDYDTDTDVESENDVEISVWTREDIQVRIDEAASEIASLLSVSMPEAVVLLSKYGWNTSRIHDEWFSDEAKTRSNLTNRDKLKYNGALRSYVKSRKNMTWCPYPGCEFVLECIGQTSSHLDVTCKCNHSLCWNCSEENHSPCDCNLVAKWTSLMNKNSENAGNDLNEKYIHCHERWTVNQKLRSKAMERIKEFAALSESHLMMTKNQLQFITDAWVQIVQSRRYLKWSYVYGYYSKSKANRDFFEFGQEVAEASLEKLQDLVENEGFTYINETEGNLNEQALNINDNMAEFEPFHVRVTRLTETTRKKCNDLVEILANNLSEDQESQIVDCFSDSD